MSAQRYAYADQRQVSVAALCAADQHVVC